MPYSLVSSASRKSTKKYKLGPTDDRKGVQETQPVENRYFRSFQSNCIRIGNSYAVGHVDRKAGYQSETKSGFPTLLKKKKRSRSQLFASAKIFRRDARIGLVERFFFYADRMSHHPTKLTIKPPSSLQQS